ncbi:MAG: hypothetical protein U1E61_18450 [Bradyrhizobium sp.]
MFRRTMMASAIAVLKAPVMAANNYPKAFLRMGRRRLARPQPLMA